MSLRLGSAWLLVPTVAACGGTPRVEVEAAKAFEMLRDGGYRVAVLPFVVAAPGDWAAEFTDLSDVSDLLALDGMQVGPTDQKWAAILRRAFVAALDGGSFQVAELWVTDTRLRHAGHGPQAFADASRGAELAALLDVDGVVLGEVTDWSRDETLPMQSVGFRLRLVDRRSSEMIFETRRSEWRADTTRWSSAGGPSGPVALHTLLPQLARSVARAAAADVTGAKMPPATDAGTARGSAPVLSFHAIAGERDGRLKAGDRLQVVAIGAADCVASFDLGRYRVGIPMVQVARTEDARGVRAAYVGYYSVQPGERLAPVPVYVSLTRAEGGRMLCSRHRLAGTAIAIVD